MSDPLRYTVNKEKCDQLMSRGETYRLLHENRMALIALFGAMTQYKSGNVQRGDQYIEDFQKAFDKFDAAMKDLVFNWRSSEDG